ncbi:hypothetical protein N780_08425 [Pontibacillus chungwhensis BH030062]|uniref:Uncharacterized protein n=1 Tax=Pontibacillus chungwhensis BH030062 TaxID=1385513 RepID=A0A0A2USE0_9BACI|nr:hypothetical protein [Pontibacillus chungwhensis]KGP91232.1 hypothetical protein N780_08425 [Pontibacillus chungwhensis BH030062]
MTEVDSAMTLYILFMIIATFVSFTYGSIMIRKTGLFQQGVLIAGTLNFLLGLGALMGWFFFAGAINEFLLFGGLVLGIGLLIAGEAVLVAILLLKRKKWLQIYHDS